MSIADQLPNEVFFDVVEKPIFRRSTPVDGLFPKPYGGSIAPVENYKALVRTDNDETLAVVTDRYQLLQHGEACALLDRAFDKAHLTPNVYKHSDTGRKLDFIVNIPELKINDGESDLEYSFWITNGYGGVSSFGLQAGMFRLLCFNGMILGVKEINWRRRHTGALIGDAENMIAGILATLPQAQVHMREEIDKFQNTVIIDPNCADHNHSLYTNMVNGLELPNKYVKSIMHIREDTSPFEFSLWDMYNDVTNVLSTECNSLVRQYQLTGQARKALLGYVEETA